MAYLESFSDVSSPADERWNSPDSCPQPRQADEDGRTATGDRVETLQGSGDDFVSVVRYHRQRVDRVEAADASNEPVPLTSYIPPPINS